MLENPSIVSWNYKIFDEDTREFLLATIYDTSTSVKEEGLVIVRDGYGKYAWKVDLRYRLEPWHSKFIDIDFKPSPEPSLIAESTTNV